MKKKKFARKLGLKKITIANLSDRDMSMVLGGNDPCDPSTIYCSQTPDDFPGTLHLNPGSIEG